MQNRKDRNFILKVARDKLRGTDFKAQEQFPSEVVERRNE
jgi:hypothetical protein